LFRQEQQKSAYYAYPLVDTKLLLQCVIPSAEAELNKQDESGSYYIFESTFTLPSANEEEEDYKPLFMISKDHVKSISSLADVRSTDFMLVADPGFKLEKAYSIKLVHPQHKDSCIAWNGFVNMSKPLMHMQGKKTPPFSVKR
jgi:hypothetical protein